MERVGFSPTQPELNADGCEVERPATHRYGETMSWGLSLLHFKGEPGVFAAGGCGCKYDGDAGFADKGGHSKPCDSVRQVTAHVHHSD